MLEEFRSFLNAPCKDSIARVKVASNQMKVTQLVQWAEDWISGTGRSTFEVSMCRWNWPVFVRLRATLLVLKAAHYYYCSSLEEGASC